MAFGVLGQKGNVAVTVETQLKPEIEHVIHQIITMMIIVHLIVRETRKKPVTALRDAAHLNELLSGENNFVENMIKDNIF